MKKLKCIAAVLFLAVSLTGIIYLQYMIDGQMKSDKTKKRTAVTEYVGPDLEYLKEYGLDAFETALPVLYIDTRNQRLSKENRTWASMAVLEANPDGSENSIERTPNYVSPITIKLRGASSYAGFDKAQYRIKFYKKEGSSKENNHEFLGMGKHSEWVLNGPFLDRTLIRNRLTYGIGKEIFEWAPDCRYVEVFVDGKYQGVYLAVEPVTNGETRLRISEFGLLSGVTSYVVKRDRSDSEENPIPVYGKIEGKTNNELFIDYPSAGRITPKQRQWITKDISDFERALYSDEFDDPVEGYGKYIDVDCFVDYYILNELSMNYDAGNLSTYIYKELGGKMQLAIWDYNNAYDNYQAHEKDYTEFQLKENAWFSRLIEDRNFVDKVVKRYAALRKTVFNTESLYSDIDQYKAELGPAIDRNFAVWGYTFNQNLLSSGDRDPVDYESAILQLKEIILMRTEFLDSHFTDLYSNCIN